MISWHRVSESVVTVLLGMLSRKVIFDFFQGQVSSLVSFLKSFLMMSHRPFEMDH